MSDPMLDEQHRKEPVYELAPCRMCDRPTRWRIDWCDECGHAPMCPACQMTHAEDR